MYEYEKYTDNVAVSFASCTVLCTGDLLVGKKDATRHEVLDAMIANWMHDPVHGTKAGYLKLAMKLAERVEADLVPKAKRTVQKMRAASSATSRGMSAAGADLIRATTSLPGRTRIREGDGSPASHAAATDEAAAVEAAEAEDEAALPITTTRARLLSARTPFVHAAVVTVVVYFFYCRVSEKNV
jgi:hypothetical protein